jgi:hypothetical protein
MTKPKPRLVAPYTDNRAFSVSTANEAFQENIIKVIREFFQDTHLVEECLAQMWEAITAYDLASTSNPDRMIAQRQMQDLLSLLETMKELRVRLDPVHIPLPLLINARAKYTPTNGGASTLDEEIQCVLAMLVDLHELFLSTGIPSSDKTNPGKPERNKLVIELQNTFDSLVAKDTSYSMSSHKEILEERRDFVIKVCSLIDDKIIIPRTI